MVEQFLQWCQRFLVAEEDLIRHLQEQGFVCADRGWNFTLPQLHRFLAAQRADDEAPSYSLFRQQLFNSSINADLAEKHAEIVIVDNKGKVDLSTYRLQHRTTG